MDNITHSLVGFAVGQSLSGERQSSVARKAIILAAVVGANFPDLDALWAGLVSGKIGALLNHRGHTHTLLMLLPQLILLVGALMLWKRWRKRDDGPWPWRRITLSGSLGLLSHLFLDFWNNYGIHPFWPFNNDWYYGDAVFILEPWIWWLMIPALTFYMQGRLWKVLSWGVLVLITGLGFLSKFVDPTIVFSGVLVALISAVVARKTSWGLAWNWLALSLLVITQFTISQHVNAMLAGPEVVDRIRSPFPANPRCWLVGRVIATPKDYIVQVGTVAIAGATLKDCQNTLTRPGFEKNRAPLTPVTPGLGHTDQIKWDGQFVALRKELETLSKNCQVSAFFQFARAPYFFPSGDQIQLGDLRYEKGGDFSYFKVEKKPSSCPQHLPPWNPPLQKSGLLTKS